MVKSHLWISAPPDLWQALVDLKPSRDLFYPRVCVWDPDLCESLSCSQPLLFFVSPPVGSISSLDLAIVTPECSAHLTASLIVPELNTCVPSSCQCLSRLHLGMPCPLVMCLSPCPHGLSSQLLASGFSASSWPLPTVLSARSFWQDLLPATAACTNRMIYWAFVEPSVCGLVLKDEAIPLESSTDAGFTLASWGSNTTCFPGYIRGTIFYVKRATHMLLSCKGCFDTLHQKDRLISRKG